MTPSKGLLPTVVSFLLGEGPLDGLWFGEAKAGKPFWWRHQLRAAWIDHKYERTPTPPSEAILTEDILEGIASEHDIECEPNIAPFGTFAVNKDALLKAFEKVTRRPVPALPPAGNGAWPEFAAAPHLTPSSPCERMGDEVFVLFRAWSDTMENDVSDAFGYEPYAVTISKNIAEQEVKNGGIVTKESHGWAAKEGAPRIKYKKLPLLATQSASPDTQTIIGLLQPIADQDWHGKWRIQKAIAILGGQAASPEPDVELIMEVIDSELDSQGVREGRNRHLISVNSGICDLKKVAGKVIAALRGES